MARTRTLQQIRDEARSVADLPDGSCISDTEANAWINEGYGKLYGLLVRSQIGYYAVTAQSFTTDGITPNLTLAADFGYVVGFDYQVDADRWVPLRRIDHRDVTDYRVTGDIAEAWLLDGATRIVLLPRPSAGKVYRLRYIPFCPVLVNNGDLVDGVAGFERFIVAYTAGFAKTKEGDLTAAALLFAECAKIEEDIREQADDRLLQDTGRIRDLGECGRERDSADYWPYRRGWI